MNEERLKAIVKKWSKVLDYTSKTSKVDPLVEGFTTGYWDSENGKWISNKIPIIIESQERWLTPEEIEKEKLTWVGSKEGVK